jgi:hypothetical protein
VKVWYKRRRDGALAAGEEPGEGDLDLMALDLEVHGVEVEVEVKKEEEEERGGEVKVKKEEGEGGVCFEDVETRQGGEESASSSAYIQPPSSPFYPPSAYIPSPNAFDQLSSSPAPRPSAYTPQRSSSRSVSSPSFFCLPERPSSASSFRSLSVVESSPPPHATEPASPKPELINTEPESDDIKIKTDSTKSKTDNVKHESNNIKPESDSTKLEPVIIKYVTPMYPFSASPGALVCSQNRRSSTSSFTCALCTPNDGTPPPSLPHYWH